MKRKDSLPTIWQLEAHTRAKHEILRRYLDAWFPILGRWNRRVAFLDGFAGPGIYQEGELGSPMLALTALLDHPALPRLSSCEFFFIFLEPDAARFESLQQQIKTFIASRGPLPPNIVIEAERTLFEEAAGTILADLKEQKARLAPTLAFIDPFGWTGLPLELICRLLAFDRCELVVNFMVDWINRFVVQKDQHENFRQLFGTDAFAEANALEGRARLEFLRDLYQAQLVDRCGFRYVRSFEMIHNNGHTGNLLIYGTRNLKGLAVMKEAMWKVDPGGGIVFSDRSANGQEGLFSGERVDLGPLRQALLERFSGQEVDVETISEFVLVETQYANNHWNRGVLNPLEREGRVEVVRTPRKKPFTFPPGTFVRFNE